MNMKHFYRTRDRPGKRVWNYAPLTLTDSNSVMSQFTGFNNRTINVGNATVTVFKLTILSAEIIL